MNGTPTAVAEAEVVAMVVALLVSAECLWVARDAQVCLPSTYAAPRRECEICCVSL